VPLRTRFISKLSELAAQLRQSVAGFILPEDRSGVKTSADSASLQPAVREKQAEDGVVSQSPRMFVNENSA
jgi:hypothetical protein